MQRAKQLMKHFDDLFIKCNTVDDIFCGFLNSLWYCDGGEIKLIAIYVDCNQRNPLNFNYFPT